MPECTANERPHDKCNDRHQRHTLNRDVLPEHPAPKTKRPEHRHYRSGHATCLERLGPARSTLTLGFTRSVQYGGNHAATHKRSSTLAPALGTRIKKTLV